MDPARYCSVKNRPSESAAACATSPDSRAISGDAGFDDSSSIFAAPGTSAPSSPRAASSTSTIPWLNSAGIVTTA